MAPRGWTFGWFHAALQESPRACLILGTHTCVRRTRSQVGTRRGRSQPPPPCHTGALLSDCPQAHLQFRPPSWSPDQSVLSGTSESHCHLSAPSQSSSRNPYAGVRCRHLPDLTDQSAAVPSSAVPPCLTPSLSPWPQPWPPPPWPHEGISDTRAVLTSPLLLASPWLPSTLGTKSQGLCLAFEAQ